MSYSKKQRRAPKPKSFIEKPKRNDKGDKLLSRNERLREGFKKWTSFYRANPHRFAKEYLGLNLKLFQLMLIYLMNRVNFFMYIAARGNGKSFIIAVYAVIRCILYPGTKIIIASATKNQAKLIITQKIEKELMSWSDNLKREVKSIKSSNSEVSCTFHNGSTIEAVTSTDNSRGYRGNILILDEFRLIKYSTVRDVLRPFLNVTRQPPYLRKPEYRHLSEENKEIYISSAWYKSDWIWSRFKSFTSSMIKGNSYFSVAFPYTLSLEEGLLSQNRVEQIRNEEDFDEISWMMEMESLFFGSSEKAYFNLEDIQKCRVNKQAFFPEQDINYIENKNKRAKKKKRQAGEIRILGVDVAMMGGNENDATIFTLMRLIPNGDHYDRYVSNIESMVGQHSHNQAVKLKQLYYDFEADYIAMDTAGSGISLYDDCAKITYDEKRDIEYPAFSAMNNESMASRADKGAIKNIYSIKVVQAEVNHRIATSLRSAFEKNRIKLLVDEIKARDHLNDTKDFEIKSDHEKSLLLRPYIQTTALINEMVNLEYEIRGGFIKLKEIGRNRKDRFSSLAYANHYADVLEEEHLKREVFDEDDDIIYF